MSKKVPETSKLDDILHRMAQHYQAVALERTAPNKTDFVKAKREIVKLIQETRINELLGLKYALNVDKDAYMHRILDIRIKHIEGQLK